MSILLLASQHLLYIVPHSIIKMDRLKRIDGTKCTLTFFNIKTYMSYTS